MKGQGGYLESVEEIPEPHAFSPHVRMGQQDSGSGLKATGF